MKHPPGIDCVHKQKRFCVANVCRIGKICICYASKSRIAHGEGNMQGISCEKRRKNMVQADEYPGKTARVSATRKPALQHACAARKNILYENGICKNPCLPPVESARCTVPRGQKKENTDWTHTIGCAENMRQCLDTTMFPDMVQKEKIFFPGKPWKTRKRWIHPESCLDTLGGKQPVTARCGKGKNEKNEKNFSKRVKNVLQFPREVCII